MNITRRCAKGESNVPKWRRKNFGERKKAAGATMQQNAAAIVEVAVPAVSKLLAVWFLCCIFAACLID